MKKIKPGRWVKGTWSDVGPRIGIVVDSPFGLAFLDAKDHSIQYLEVDQVVEIGFMMSDDDDDDEPTPYEVERMGHLVWAIIHGSTGINCIRVFESDAELSVYLNARCAAKESI